MLYQWTVYKWNGPCWNTYDSSYVHCGWWVSPWQSCLLFFLKCGQHFFFFGVMSLISTHLLKYLSSLLPSSTHYYFCFKLQIIDLLLWSRNKLFFVSLLSLPKLIRLLQSRRESMVVYSVPIPHFFVHKSKRTALFQISRHLNSFVLFICTHIYPSGFHLEPKPKSTERPQQRLLSSEFLAHRKREALVIAWAPSH